MRKLSLIVFALMSLMTLAACSRAAPASEPTPASVAETTHAATPVTSVESTDDGLRLMAEQFIENGRIRLTVWVNRTTLRPLQTLRATARIENVSAEEVSFTRLSTASSEPMRLLVQDPYGEHIALEPVQRGRGFFGVVLDKENRTESLGPGESIGEEIVWDTNIYGRGSGPYDSISAPNGEYHIRAQFYIDQSAALEEGQPTLVSVPVEIMDSWDPAPPEEVLENLFHTPRGKLWLDTHTGDGVTRKINGRHYVNIGGWKIADQGAYKRALQSTISDTMLVLRKDYWLLNIYSEYGPHRHPETIGAKADLKTGEILSVFPSLNERFEGGVVARFFVGDTSFKVLVKNPDTIEELFRIQRGERVDWTLEGKVTLNDESKNYNWPWYWQLDPQDTHITNSPTTPGCESRIGYLDNLVAEHPDDSTLRFCTNAAVLVDIADYRDKELFKWQR